MRRCVRAVRRMLRRGLSELRDVVDGRLEVIEEKRRALQEEEAGEGAGQVRRSRPRRRPRAAARAVTSVRSEARG